MAALPPVVVPPPPIGAGVVVPPLVGAGGVAPPPQMPFAPVPGTLTSWLVTETAGQPNEGLVTELTDAEHRYHEVDQINPEFAPIARQILGADVLLCFLTARSTERGPVVSLVHSFGQHSQGFVGRNGQAKVYGLMGETVDGQSPSIVAAAEGFEEVVSAYEYPVPTAVAVDLFFCELGNPGRFDAGASWSRVPAIANRVYPACMGAVLSKGSTPL